MVERRRVEGRLVVAGEVLIMGGLCAFSVFTGMGVLAGLTGVAGGLANVAAAMGPNWAEDVAQRGYQTLAGRWFTTQGVLNQHIARALVQALETAAPQTADAVAASQAYKRAHYANATEAEPLLETIRALGDTAKRLLNDPKRLAELDGRDRLTALMQGEPSLLQTGLDDYLTRHFAGLDPDLVKLAQDELVRRWQIGFDDILKEPGDPGRGAWIACQRLWQESLSASVAQMQADLAETRRAVAWLQEWAQLLEAGAVTIEFETSIRAALSAALDPVREQLISIEAYVRLLPEVADTVASIKQDTVVIKGDTRRLPDMDRKLDEVHVAVVHQRSAQPTTPWQFPPRAEHFTGRGAELAWLMDALEKGRTVTLCAAGGMGKTALASEALHRLADGQAPPVVLAPNDGEGCHAERSEASLLPGAETLRSAQGDNLAAQGDDPRILAGLFPDGVVTHSFYGRPATDAAFQSILNAYGAEPQGELADAVHGLLANRTALIVLDGAEQAADLTAVRRAIPDTCGELLTTRLNSQAPDTAWRCELHPLHAAQAVTLLREYAGEWAQDDTGAEEVCKRVGYLPLALRLAGRYLAARQVSAAEYAADLDALALSALELDAKHASDSVPKLMGMSAAQVSDEARAALGVAGLLALRAFDGELVAAALGVEAAQARRALSELVDYGLLVRRASSGRYDTGHALVHSYARTELAADDAAANAVAVRLAAYLGKQFRENGTDFERLDRLRPHVIALLERLGDRELWAVIDSLAFSVRDYTDLQGYWADRIAVIQAALNARNSQFDGLLA